MSFYGKVRRASGMTIRAHVTVSDEAIAVAADRIDRVLAGCPGVAANLQAAGAELHVVGKDQAVSDLPMYRHLKGRPFDGSKTIDERGRGYGGLHACCGEESLLCLPSARHADHRDICSHELAHTVLSFGVDETIRAAVVQRWRDALALGRWRGAYAGTNADEFFAETTMWYVGSRGDYGSLSPRPEQGRAWLASYDPETDALLDAVYTGKRVPNPVTWSALPRSRARRSGQGRAPTTVVFVNEAPVPLALTWIDPSGGRHPYGVIAPETVRAQPTYVTHLWELTDEVGSSRGRFRATGQLGLVRAA